MGREIGKSCNKRIVQRPGFIEAFGNGQAKALSAEDIT